MARQGRPRAGCWVGFGVGMAGGRWQEGRTRPAQEGANPEQKKQETKEGKGYGRNGDGNVKVDFQSI
ncbi:unnamed protein product [Fusarium graminearum]|uniref:Chromosome 3, complete genome n=1 Tax=Gibberella zeae (strain ATCC MYA-4620 / CBS 123657 / FGSC 9075 / NRRL 31084 / PH-1) TaxID=229533 RepID=A0A098E1D3_GIBZE|nr:unnamed protein product [Fusarium graminearum]CZS83604.1 unnamed protein product [Fusarium graminearum]